MRPEAGSRITLITCGASFPHMTVVISIDGGGGDVGEGRWRRILMWVEGGGGDVGECVGC